MNIVSIDFFVLSALVISVILKESFFFCLSGKGGSVECVHNYFGTRSL